jgi:hypothetical protein
MEGAVNLVRDPLAQDGCAYLIIKFTHGNPPGPRSFFDICPIRSGKFHHSSDIADPNQHFLY